MSDAEQQVTERLRAYAGALPVTHADIHQAHNELHDRLSERAHHRTRTAVLAVAASVVLIACAVVLRHGIDRSAPTMSATRLSAPTPRAPAGHAPTVDRLTGIWTSDEAPSVLVRFGADGTYSYDDRGRLDTYAAVHGTYRVHGRTISFTPVGGYACPGKGPHTSLAGLPEVGRLDLVVSKPTAGDRDCAELVGARSTLTRVSPQSPAGARITGNRATGQVLTADRESQLYGIWLHQGTGRLLRIASDGSYAVDDGGELATSPDDNGTFAVEGPGRLQLTSAAGSRECAPGERTTWAPVRVTSTSLSVTIQEDTCTGRADLAGSWVRLS
jgi:hypothetical protein